MQRDIFPKSFELYIKLTHEVLMEIASDTVTYQDLPHFADALDMALQDRFGIGLTYAEICKTHRIIRATSTIIDTTTYIIVTLERF